MFHVIPQNTSNISSSMNETLSKMDVDLNINLDYGEVEVRISQFMVLMSDPLQMRSLYHEDVLKVNEGNDLLLSCRVRGRPTPLISWYINQTEIKNPWRLETGRGIIQKSRYVCYN
ncbi:unnamed protein product [Schistosoma curassoni]|uniref:Ig-like domain-containing protein n=1 Tax=Schistosoma curassoni TaxID=6186 RepID=A0A183JWB6_9TREM|nr:unnamed protein product [Schistosoma curassoni]